MKKLEEGHSDALESLVRYVSFLLLSLLDRNIILEVQTGSVVQRTRVQSVLQVFFSSNWRSSTFFFPSDLKALTLEYHCL